MKRRHFIQHATSGLLLPAFFKGIGLHSMDLEKMATLLSGNNDDDRVLVIVYLGGGNDGINTVVPLDRMSALHSVRSHVVLPENRLLHLDGTSVGLHPAMGDMKKLYDEGRLSIIQNVGYPQPNYSHFRSTDIWMSGSDSDETLPSGWAGRYLNHEHPEYPSSYPNEEHPDPIAVEIGRSSSLLFQGLKSNFAFSINNTQDFYDLLGPDTTPSPDTKSGEKLDYVKLIMKQAQVYGKAVKKAATLGDNKIEYPDDNRLARQLKICANLISGGLKSKVYLVQINGFDTHDNQVDPSDHTLGEHADLLKEASEGIYAFMKDCDALGISDRIVGMTFSEFGRRVISNASSGTDHGTAAPMFVFGNQVQGGLYGSNPLIPQDADYTFNLPYEYDFRQIYQSVIGQHFCADMAAKEASLLRGYEELPILKGEHCTPVSTTEPFSVHKIGGIYPNPTTGKVELSGLANGTFMVEINTVTGKKIDSYQTTVVQGRIRVYLNQYPPAVYILTVYAADGPQSYKVIKR